MPDKTDVDQDRHVLAGVDTHKELHVAAVIDTDDTVLATRSFPTTRTGYRALLTWIGEYGTLVRIGVEGTGSYGAGLTRHLAKAGVTVLEVDRPDRSDRRRRAKTTTSTPSTQPAQPKPTAAPPPRNRKTVPSSHFGS
jgi:transposase